MKIFKLVHFQIFKLFTYEVFRKNFFIDVFCFCRIL
jgi:hypothetical protein